MCSFWLTFVKCRSDDNLVFRVFSALFWSALLFLLYLGFCLVPAGGTYGDQKHFPSLSVSLGHEKGMLDMKNEGHFTWPILWSDSANVLLAQPLLVLLKKESTCWGLYRWRKVRKHHLWVTLRHWVKGQKTHQSPAAVWRAERVCAWVAFCPWVEGWGVSYLLLMFLLCVLTCLDWYL